MRLIFRMSILLAMMATVAGVRGQNEAQAAPSASCTLERDVYTCNWAAFKKTLAAAQTIAVQSAPMDVHTDAELTKLVDRLGKRVAAAEDGADLTFLLVPLSTKGIYIGSVDVDLATLRVYAGRTKTQPGRLVWAETYRGAEDIPRPSAVYYTISQFEDRLKQR